MSLLSDFIRFISSKNGINDKSELLKMILKSNPKAYNIDKILDFLSQDKSVSLFYWC
jgi:phage-related protein